MMFRLDRNPLMFQRRRIDASYFAGGDSSLMSALNAKEPAVREETIWSLYVWHRKHCRMGRIKSLRRALYCWF